MCDLQSMLHKTLSHLTVITNKHHAQSLRLLFCLFRWLVSHCKGQTMEEAKKYPGLSLTEDPVSGKGKRTEMGEEPYSQAPPPPTRSCPGT